MSDLADQTLFSRSRLTYTVDNLEQRGLVVRRRDEDDGRGVVATLSASGRRLHAHLAAIHVGGIRSHFLGPLAKGEAAQLADSLEKVLTNLGARVEPPR